MAAKTKNIPTPVKSADPVATTRTVAKEVKRSVPDLNDFNVSTKGSSSTLAPVAPAVPAKSQPQIKVAELAPEEILSQVKKEVAKAKQSAPAPKAAVVSKVAAAPPKKQPAQPVSKSASSRPAVKSTVKSVAAKPVAKFTAKPEPVAVKAVALKTLAVKKAPVKTPAVKIPVTTIAKMPVTTTVMSAAVKTGPGPDQFAAFIESGTIFEKFVQDFSTQLAGFFQVWVESYLSLPKAMSEVGSVEELFVLQADFAADNFAAYLRGGEELTKISTKMSDATLESLGLKVAA